MKSLQNNNLKIDRPLVATLTKDAYLCPKIKEMSDETQFEDKMTLEPYTMEEINAMVEEGERDFEAGRVFTTEEVIDYCKTELAKLEKP